MMKKRYLILYSILVPILLRPQFPDNIEFFGVCMIMGMVYGILAGVAPQ